MKTVSYWFILLKNIKLWIKLHLLSQNAVQKYWFLCNWPNIFSTFAPINGIFTLLYEKIYQILRHRRHYFRSTSVHTPCYSPLQWERAPFRWIGIGIEWSCVICKGWTFCIFPIFKWGRKAGLTTVGISKRDNHYRIIFMTRNIYLREQKYLFSWRKIFFFVKIIRLLSFIIEFQHSNTSPEADYSQP